MNTPVKWVNTEPDAGAPHALLERLAQRLTPDVIDEIWIFPTRRIAIGESTVFVVAARTQDDDERSRVITARYAVTRNNKGVAAVQEKIDEHGTAPAAAVPRIIQGVLRRMGEEGEQPPRAERIEGDPERWWTLVEELGGKRPPLDPEGPPATAPGVEQVPADAAAEDAPAEDVPPADAPADGAAEDVPPHPIDGAGEAHYQ